MSDCIILSTWKNIEIQIAENIAVKGTLKLCIKLGAYFFTWEIDEDITNFTELRNFYILLYQIMSIQIKPISISKTGLIFIFKDLSVFPLVILPSFLASHLISYLVSKQLCKVSNKEVFVNVQPKIQSNFGDNFVHSSRFISLVQHSQILIKLTDKDTNNEQETNSVSCVAKYDNLGRVLNVSEIISDIQTKCRKISDSSRFILWTHFLNIYPEPSTEDQRKTINEENQLLYTRLQQVRLSFTEKQKTKLSQIMQNFDTNLQNLQRKENMSPFVRNMIRDVITSYIILCTDTGYHKTMENILYVFCYSFISKVNESENSVELKDETVMSRDMFCGILLQCLKKFLDNGCRAKLLTREKQSETFFTERVNKIIDVIHCQLRDWLTLYGLSDLSFLFEFASNGFCNVLRKESCANLWDFALSSPFCSSFHIFFSSSVCILLYDKLLLSTKLQSDEDFSQKFAELCIDIDIDKAIVITQNIVKILKNRGPDTSWVLVPMKQNQELLDYNPKYIQIIKH